MIRTTDKHLRTPICRGKLPIRWDHPLLCDPLSRIWANQRSHVVSSSARPTVQLAAISWLAECAKEHLVLRAARVSILSASVCRIRVGNRLLEFQVQGVPLLRCNMPCRRRQGRATFPHAHPQIGCQNATEGIA